MIRIAVSVRKEMKQKEWHGMKDNCEMSVSDPKESEKMTKEWMGPEILRDRKIAKFLRRRGPDKA